MLSNSLLYQAHDAPKTKHNHAGKLIYGTKSAHISFQKWLR